eukprot:4294114-Ditylum_brightwellii.AAC.1
MQAKNKFLIFTEAGKAIELETFPKKAPEIKVFLDYEVCKKHENVLLILYLMSPISYHDFKKPMMPWSMMNKYYMTKMIFKSSKDTIVNIGHLMNLNPFYIDKNQYKDSINKLMEAVSIKKEQKDQKFFKLLIQLVSMQNSRSNSGIAVQWLDTNGGKLKPMPLRCLQG